MQLKDKVMIVTGGGAGIGQATVLRAAREGAKVVVVYRSEGGRVQTEKMLKDQKGEGIFVQADVRQEADWIRIMKMTTDTYGRLDTLFSNAGGNLIKPITEVGVEEWDNLFALNVRGVFLGAKHAIPLMIKSGGGAIINMASAFGLIGYPHMPTYCATKGAVINLTRQLALDYARDHIRVNAICPGPVLTGRIQGYIERGQLSPEENLKGVPMARFSDPKEIASVVVFMASNEASYMNGSIVTVDGGMTVH